MILEYEWLGTMLTASNRHYAIVFDNMIGGVTCWAVAGMAIPVMMKTFKLASDEVGYLCRGACAYWTPKGAASRLIAWSCKYEMQRGTKIAIAFADTDAGEYGTVYQAAGWTCIGRGTLWPQYVSPQGKIWSHNQMTANRKKSGVKTGEYVKKLLLKGWKKQIANPKYRYVRVLATGEEKQRLDAIVESMKVEYPKRPAGVTAARSASSR